jgi:hypothetical protein
MHALDEQKIVKLINRRYLEDAKGRCRNTIPRHPVPKGTDAIRVVWDCTNNRVNPTIYTPSFWLPMIATLCRRFLANSEQGDFYIEEEFHNYILHKYESQFHEVLVPTRVCDTYPIATPLMRFTVPPFRWTSSPYFTLRMLARVIELAKNPRHDTTSPFNWEKVVLNLPSSEGYKPSLPRVMLIRPDGLTADGCLTFFDDGRVYGPNKHIVQQAFHHICAKVQWYVNQEA